VQEKINGKMRSIKSRMFTFHSLLSCFSLSICNCRNSKYTIKQFNTI